ncbi:MAG: ferrochelatase [Acidobacteria bacterium]|nr:ferrochelatase [Acidobacteriota bacterium]
MHRDTAILLLNLGGPVTLKHVEPFLYALFSDRDLIKLPGPAWFQPTYAWGISKLRRKGAMQRYAEIGGGSPLLRESAAQAAALRSRLRAAGIQSPVKLVFRTSAPRAKGMLAALKKEGVTKLLPVTLYPHACHATTGSSLRELEKEAKAYGMTLLPGVRDHAVDPDYIESWVQPLREALEELPYATVLFSAHSLPVKQIQASGDPYEGEVHATVDAIKARIGDIPGGFILGYQSRVGPIKWLEPNLRHLMKDLGGRDVIVLPISFVSEHIETLHELDIEYKEMADHAGVRTWKRLRTPGTHPKYVECLVRHTLEALGTGVPA